MYPYVNGLAGNGEFMLKMFQLQPKFNWAYKITFADLAENKEFLLQALKFDPTVLFRVNQSLKKDADFIIDLLGLAQEIGIHKVLDFVDADLAKDPAFLQRLKANEEVKQFIFSLSYKDPLHEKFKKFY